MAGKRHGVGGHWVGRHSVGGHGDYSAPVFAHGASKLLARWWIAIAVVLFANLNVAHGQSNVDVDGSLVAGEFSIARQAAERQTGQQRDQALAEIAIAQGVVGERRAMAHTLAQIGSNQTRNQAAFGGGQGNGNLGGGTQADFDTLIDLITTTVEPDTWEDVGGAGAIDAFPGGIYVNADGLLQQITATRSTRVLDVDQLEKSATGNRKISLPRLEQALQIQLAAGQPISKSLREAGRLARVECIIAYPETSDLVISGPVAGEGEPFLRLADIICILRSVQDGPEFGCSIDPLQANLAEAQKYLDQFRGKSISPSQRPRWLEGLRDSVGRQQVRVFGIQATSPTARTLVEADYHMKLIGMGLVDTPDGVTSYLDGIQPDANGQLPPMDLLRWWFAMDYDRVETDDRHTTFRLVGNAAKVLGENEFLDRTGRRTATGRANAENQAFSDSFSDNFDAIAQQYPVYGQLRVIFDMAAAAGIAKAYDLPGRIGWVPTTLVGDYHASEEVTQSVVPELPAPSQVETVVAHRVFGGRQIVAGVSGGVLVRPQSVASRVKVVGNQNYQLRSASEPKTDRGPDAEWSWE